MPGWGTLFGTIADWLPGKKESFRNKASRLEKEMDDILKKDIMSNADARRYNKFAHKLRELEGKIRNSD